MSAIELPVPHSFKIMCACLDLPNGLNVRGDQGAKVIFVTLSVSKKVLFAQSSNRGAAQFFTTGVSPSGAEMSFVRTELRVKLM